MRTFRSALARTAALEAPRALAAAAACLAAGGCADRMYLMPTPNIYLDPRWDPFKEVRPELQTDRVEVLYVTDRAPTRSEPGKWEYGEDRSRSAAFGTATVRFGEGLTWDALLQASRSAARPREIELHMIQVQETARFDPTPPSLVATAASMAEAPTEPASAPRGTPQERQFLEELSRRLAGAERKDVFLYVHGFDDTFKDAVLTAAEVWHFLAREGVPVCYTWPVGIGGLEAYLYTISSTDFTVFHLKQAIRLIASCPDVHRIHLLAHSRGTAALMDAMRELYLEGWSTPGGLAQLKLGTCILAAPDIDFDVVVERDSTERIGRAVDRVAIYYSEEDKALKLSRWLFGGTERLGDLDPRLFSKDEIERLRGNERSQLISARVTDLGDFNHTYFRSSPAVSSDMILLLRYGCQPGVAGGRPLSTSPQGLWRVVDGYPGPDWTPPACEPDRQPYPPPPPSAAAAPAAPAAPAPPTQGASR